jgi:hypothetical protein
MRNAWRLARRKLRRRRERHHLADITVDTSRIGAVGLLVGPYRNLTTLTVSIAALHPNCQVLNHGGVRVFDNDAVDFLARPTPEVLDAFLQYAVRISAGGERGAYGGSVLRSHAFDADVVRSAYERRYGSDPVKTDVRALVWKESMLLEQRLQRDETTSRVLTALPAVRLIHPVRDVLDCAVSNIVTEHDRFLPSGSHELTDVVDAVLASLEWFTGVRRQFPDRCFWYFEDDFDLSVLTSLADFLGVEPDDTWLDDAMSVYRLPDPYEIDTATLDHYRAEIDRRFSGEPDLQARLMRFADRRSQVTCRAWPGSAS